MIAALDTLPQSVLKSEARSAILQQMTSTINQPATAAAVLLVSAVLGSLLFWSRRNRRLPPSPGTPLPLLGHLHTLRGSDPRELFAGLRKKYGDVFSFYAGSRLVIVLNGYDVIYEALVKKCDVFSARPETFISQQMAQGHGIVNTSGEHWKEQRRFTERTLRSIGVNCTSTMEARILQELAVLTNKLDAASASGLPFDPADLLMASVSNVMMTIIYGHRFDLDDPQYCTALTALCNCFKNFGNTQPLNFFPVVRYLPGDPCGYWACLHNMHVLERTLVHPELEQHARSLSEACAQPDDDVVSAYLLEMERKRSAGTPTTMDKDNLVKVAGDLLAAGSEPPSSTVAWFLLYMIHYPEIQERCYQEIVENIGKDQSVSVSKRPSLPFTEATILEVQRHADVGPLGMAHGVSRDTELHGYDIPTDAIVIVNLHSVHHDPEIWGDPEVFRPERFLDANGCVVKSKYLIPYSLGSRKCPGEGLSRMEVFLYIGTILQRYHLSCDPGPLPSLQGNMALVHSPKPFKVRFRRR